MTSARRSAAAATTAIRRAARCLLIGTAVLAAGCASLPPEAPRARAVALPPDASSALVQAARAAQPDPALSGFHLMSGGQMALHARLELVRRASHSLDVQCYHIHDDETGRTFLRVLRDAAGRGVRVRLLLDDLYTSGQDELLAGLAAHANVELRLFNPFPAGRSSLGRRFAASLFDFGRVHRRMHNKLLVADGAMAIAGGRNIGNEYFMQRDGVNFIDLDALVVGAVLPSLSALFDSYWNSRHALPLEAIAPSAVPARRPATAVRPAYRPATDRVARPARCH